MKNNLAPHQFAWTCSFLIEKDLRSLLSSIETVHDMHLIKYVDVTIDYFVLKISQTNSILTVVVVAFGDLRYYVLEEVL